MIRTIILLAIAIASALLGATRLTVKNAPVIETPAQTEIIELLNAEEPVVEEEEPVVETQKTIVSTDYGMQPKQAIGNYAGNTAQLNAYAHSHMIRVHVWTNPTRMEINLKKPVTTEGRNVIIYIKTNNRYCGGRVLTAVKWNMFELDITNMDMQGTKCDGNRSEKISWKDILIWGYITTYDGNWIESIIFN